MDDGRRVLRREQLMAGVPEMLDEVAVEATFPDGRKLVTLHRPVPVMLPGESSRAPAIIALAPGRERRTVASRTPATARSRSAPTFTSRTSTRRWRSIGRPRRASVSMCPPARRCASSRAWMSRSAWWRSPGRRRSRTAGPPVSSIDRGRYAALYGPTTGDRVRLADTDIIDRGRVRSHRAARRRGRVRRRQDDPRVDAPGRRHSCGGCPRRRDHQRAGARSPRYLQGRRRHPRRAHRRRWARPATRTSSTA